MLMVLSAPAYDLMFSYKEEDYHENRFYRLRKYGDCHAKGNSVKR